MGEAQDVALAVAQDLQQQSGLALAGAGAVAGGVGQPDRSSVAQPAQQPLADVGGDRDVAARAGEVGVVDQFAQRPGDLRGPDRVGIDLGGIVKITQQVSVMPISA